MGLKEEIFNSFHICRMWWSWKKSFLTISILGGCGHLEKRDFYLFLLWVDLVFFEITDFQQFLIFGGCGCSRKKCIFNSFYSWEGVVLLKEENFNSFHYLEDVVVLKEVIFNSFYIWWVCWSWKKRFLTVSIFGRKHWSWKKSFLTVFIFWEGVVHFEKRDF